MVQGANSQWHNFRNIIFLAMYMFVTTVRPRDLLREFPRYWKVFLTTVKTWTPRSTSAQQIEGFDDEGSVARFVVYIRSYPTVSYWCSGTSNGRSFIGSASRGIHRVSPTKDADECVLRIVGTAAASSYLLTFNFFPTEFIFHVSLSVSAHCDNVSYRIVALPVKNNVLQRWFFYPLSKGLRMKRQPRSHHYNCAFSYIARWITSR